MRPHNLRLSHGREIGGASKGVPHRVVEVVGVNGFSSTRTGVSDDSIYGTASGSADMQRSATLGRCRLRVSET